MFLSNRGSFRPETSGAYTLRRRGRRRPKSGSAIGACAVARLAGSGGPIGDYYGSANNIQSAWEEHGNDVEFVIVNMTDMNGETEQSAKAFLAENNYTFPCYFDANNSAATAFGVSSIPQTYLINAEGNIIGAYMGAMDASVIAQGIDMLTGNTAAPAAQ